MTYRALNKRYNNMKYRNCGSSGLKLPLISLGLWHNFGGSRVNLRRWQKLDLRPHNLPMILRWALDCDRPGMWAKRKRRGMRPQMRHQSSVFLRQDYLLQAPWLIRQFWGHLSVLRHLPALHARGGHQLAGLTQKQAPIIL